MIYNTKHCVAKYVRVEPSQYAQEELIEDSEFTRRLRTELVQAVALQESQNKSRGGTVRKCDIGWTTCGFRRNVFDSPVGSKK